MKVISGAISGAAPVQFRESFWGHFRSRACTIPGVPVESLQLELERELKLKLELELQLELELECDFELERELEHELELDLERKLERELELEPFPNGWLSYLPKVDGLVYFPKLLV